MVSDAHSARPRLTAMPDLGRFLPLSHRSPADESDVTSDRRTQLADVIDLAAAALPRQDAGATATAIAAFLTASRIDVGQIPTDARGLRAAAELVRTGRRRSIRALARGVRALLLLARETDHDVALDPLTSGSVALYAATAAPLARRAVVSAHTVRATDADWAFGRGPVLEGPAVQIVAFLLGVSETPPSPPPSPPAAAPTA